MALQRGDTGAAVLAAQVLLRVPRTGTFDAITELAVVLLQQTFGLPVNGILDTAEYAAARHGSSHEAAGADPIAVGVLYTPNLTPADVGATDGYVEQYFTVTGLTLSDTVIVNPPVMAANPHCALISYRVSAVDTLALTFRAISGTHPPPAGVYRVLAFRS